jgi:hypothetical protein
MTDMQVAVGLRRKAGYDRPAMLAASDILGDYLADEILRCVSRYFSVVHRIQA